MPRKLIHSLRALVVTLGVFAAGLVVGIPANLNAMPDATVPQVETVEAAVIGAPAPLNSATKPVAPTHRQRRRHARDEIALPFFSFAHVLRSGNGS